MASRPAQSTHPRPRKRASAGSAAAAAVEGAALGVADGIGRHGLDDSLPRAAEATADVARRASRSDRLRARLERVDERVTEALDATKGKAHAIAEAARRARHVPPAVARDVGRAGKAYAGGIGASLGLYAAAGAIGIAAATVLTVALVQSFERLWGEPWGALAVALLYGLLAVVCMAAARGRVERGKREARDRLEVARTELRHVTEPLRQAFGRAAPPPGPLEAPDLGTAPFSGNPPLAPPAPSGGEAVFPDLSPPRM